MKISGKMSIIIYLYNLQRLKVSTWEVIFHMNSLIDLYFYVYCLTPLLFHVILLMRIYSPWIHTQLFYTIVEIEKFTIIGKLLLPIKNYNLITVVKYNLLVNKKYMYPQMSWTVLNSPKWRFFHGDTILTKILVIGVFSMWLILTSDFDKNIENLDLGSFIIM